MRGVRKGRGSARISKKFLPQKSYRWLRQAALLLFALVFWSAFDGHEVAFAGIIPASEKHSSPGGESAAWHREAIFNIASEKEGVLFPTGGDGNQEAPKVAGADKHFWSIILTDKFVAKLPGPFSREREILSAVVLVKAGSDKGWRRSRVDDVDAARNPFASYKVGGIGSVKLYRIDQQMGWIGAPRKADLSPPTGFKGTK